MCVCVYVYIYEVLININLNIKYKFILSTIISLEAVYKYNLLLFIPISVITNIIVISDY